MNKMARFAVIFLCISKYSFAVDIITTAGKTYSDVAVQRVEPDGISIKHSAGIIKLFVGELPNDIAEKYGLTAEGARAYQAQRIASVAQREQQMTANVMAERSGYEQKAKAEKQAKANADRVKMWKLHVSQTDSSGTWAYTESGKSAFIVGYFGSADGAYIYLSAYSDGLYRDGSSTALKLVPAEMPPKLPDYRGIRVITK